MTGHHKIEKDDVAEFLPAHYNSVESNMMMVMTEVSEQSITVTAFPQYQVCPSTLGS